MPGISVVQTPYCTTLLNISIWKVVSYLPPYRIQAPGFTGLAVSFVHFVLDTQIQDKHFVDNQTQRLPNLHTTINSHDNSAIVSIWVLFGDSTNLHEYLLLSGIRGLAGEYLILTVSLWNASRLDQVRVQG